MDNEPIIIDLIKLQMAQHFKNNAADWCSIVEDGSLILMAAMPAYTQDIASKFINFALHQVPELVFDTHGTIQFTGNRIVAVVVYKYDRTALEAHFSQLIKRERDRVVREMAN